MKSLLGLVTTQIRLQTKNIFLDSGIAIVLESSNHYVLMVIITLLRGLRRKVKTEKLFYFRLLGNYRQVEDNDNNSEHIQRGKNGGKRELSISQNKVNKELILKAIMHQPSTIQNDNNAGSGVVSIYVFVTHLPNKLFAFNIVLFFKV